MILPKCIYLLFMLVFVRPFDEQNAEAKEEENEEEEEEEEEEI